MPRRIRTHRVSLIAGLVVLLLFGAAATAFAQYGAHPRIYLTPERLDRIRTQHWQGESYEWERLMITADRSDIYGAKARALAYAVTGDETYATEAVDILTEIMVEVPVPSVTFNSCGPTFNHWALCFDWLYNSPQFTSSFRQQVIDYISQIPKDGSGKWNWYPDHAYFNGVSKMIWGPPIWGMATHGDNPIAQDYIDNGYENRWIWIRNTMGYGPANLAVVRGGCMPQGMDYGSGTMSNIVRYLAAVKSATGQNLFDEAPALRQYLEYFVRAYYYTDDFIRRPEHGHNAHKRGGYMHNATASLLILMDEYSDTPEAQMASWWFENVDGAARYPGVDSRYFAYLDVIFSDATIPQRSPFDKPLAYFAEGNGMWICRSDWTSGATETNTFATFRAGNWTWFNQNQWDQGNYCIYSHGEDLLVDGGLYEGGGGFTVINYHNQTIAHNSITVKDPGQTKGWHFYDWTLDTYENTGGQNRPWRETVDDAMLDGAPKDPDWPQAEGGYLHDMSDVTRRTHNERYTYAFADLTNAYANERWEQDYESNRLADVDYSPKVSNVTRHWYYLRSSAENDDEYFVAFDRVNSLDADFQKKSYLHFIGEPTFENGSRIDTEVSGHIETWRSDRFRMELGGAVLHGAAVLPADAEIRKVGGTGYEYWVNGTNYDPWPDTENELGGQWRLEIMPPTAQRDDLFLTVLHPDDIGAPAPEVERIAAANYEGAAFDGWVTMFSKTEDSPGEVTYVVSMSGEQRHLVADMQAGYSYRIYHNGDPSPMATITAGPEGIVEFESPGGGSFTVTQGDYVPDETPPTGSVAIAGDDCTAQTTATLELSAQDGESGMGWMRFSSDGVNWSDDYAYQDFWAWPLPAGDGPKTVHVLFGDVLGNWMSEPVTASVTLDATAPDGAFNIEELVVEGSQVTLSCDASESGCAGSAVTMSFSNNGVSWSSPEPLASTRVWDLAATGEGVYTVYARYADALGNVSDPPLSDTVELDLPSDDTTPPEIYGLTPADGAEGVNLTSSVAFMVRDIGSGVDTESLGMAVDGDAMPITFVQITAGRYMVVTEPGGLEPNTTYTIGAGATDLADPANLAAVVWTFTTGENAEETQPPAPPTGLAVDVDAECAISVDWYPSSDPNVVAYRVAWGEWPDGEASHLEYQTEIGASLTGQPDGSYWVSVLALDMYGLESPQTRVGEAVVLNCSGDPGDPEDPEDPELPGLEPDFGSLSQGEIWPPGVIVDRPNTALSVANMGRGWTVRIFTVSGRLVYSHRAETDGEDFTWDLLNRKGSRVAKGLYLVRVFDVGGGLVKEGKYLRR